MNRTKPIRVDENIHTQFFVWCVNNHISMTQQIGRLITEFLSREDK